MLNRNRRFDMKPLLYPNLDRSKLTKAELEELLELEELEEARYQDWYEDAEQQL